jgi:hypothetical protein
MKNIHLLSTLKPSRLLYSGNNKNLLFSKEPISFRTFERSPQNIYITNSEEIKEGDWFFNPATKEALYASKEMISWNCDTTQKHKGWKKIILTTDQDLITDGVQATDDEFLEWFVENPSCEYVDVNDWMDTNGNIAFGGNIRYQISCSTYKEIIIPKEEPKYTTSNLDNEKYKDYSVSKEEPKQREMFLMNANTIIDTRKHKQETLEEAAERLFKEFQIENPIVPNNHIRPFKLGFIKSAKWQQEKMYSEEDLRNAYRWGTTVNHGTKEHFNEWFEQHKKK